MPEKPGPSDLMDGPDGSPTYINTGQQKPNPNQSISTKTDPLSLPLQIPVGRAPLEALRRRFPHMTKSGDLRLPSLFSLDPTGGGSPPQTLPRPLLSPWSRRAALGRMRRWRRGRMRAGAFLPSLASSGWIPAAHKRTAGGASSRLSLSWWIPRRRRCAATAIRGGAFAFSPSLVDSRAAALRPIRQLIRRGWIRNAVSPPLLSPAVVAVDPTGGAYRGWIRTGFSAASLLRPARWWCPMVDPAAGE